MLHMLLFSIIMLLTPTHLVPADGAAGGGGSKANSITPLSEWEFVKKAREIIANRNKGYPKSTSCVLTGKHHFGTILAEEQGNLLKQIYTLLEQTRKEKKGIVDLGAGSGAIGDVIRKLYPDVPLFEYEPREKYYPEMLTQRTLHSTLKELNEAIGGLTVNWLCIWPYCSHEDGDEESCYTEIQRINHLNNKSQGLIIFDQNRLSGSKKLCDNWKELLDGFEMKYESFVGGGFSSLFITIIGNY